VRTGDVIDGRFLILQPVGSGGMGTVFKAVDRSDGQDVAVKVLRDADQSHAHRFEREAELLSELRHPGIVRYIGHGRTPALEAYLVMEWLEGEDLAHRLTGQGLTPPEALKVVARAAEALAVAHAKGIIHRDIKPPNVFLVNGEIDRAKILDFGVARLVGSARQSTQMGTVLGTPGYMSPEQARGAPDVDARADIFSLGCLLFEGLTGRAAFQGAHAMALLAKILLEEAPHVRELRPDLPEALDALVADMMAKDPAARPQDAGAVLTRIASLGAMANAAAAPAAKHAPAITTGERRLLCVILAEPGGEADPAMLQRTLTSAPLPSPEAWASPTLHTGQQRIPIGRIITVAAAHQGQAEQIADGSVVVTLSGAKVATDQASRAAQCALALRELMPEARMSLATGRGIVAERWPMGEVIDRAAAMLRQTGPGGGGVRVDEVTARLLGSRFDVAEGPSGFELRGVRTEAETARLLLGKPTPCVGRDRELASLEALFAECVDEPVARAVIVTAPPGGGKTRLRDELLPRLRKRQGPSALEVWVGSGDPLSAGAAFGLLAQAIRGAASLRLGDPLELRQTRLRSWVSRHLHGEDLERCVEFVAEVAGAPFGDDKSVQLRAARQDAMLMGDQIRRALEDLISTECAAGPVLLVLEDLHWGDLPTVRLVEGALRRNAEQPLFVLALARPEIDQLFPALWVDRGAQPIRLGALTRKAAEKLVRAVLGEGVDAALLARLIELAEGNALYLEELIRAVGEGKGDALPESVVSMLEARLEGLEDEARRVLRAASIFGRVFWSGGVRGLLGDDQRKSQTRDWLGRLVELEVVARRDPSRFPGEDEYAFRHALVVDAAYAMLTDKDRRLGHRLAGEWMERAGESEPLVLAQHFEQGQEPLRAVAWYGRAAQQALEANDLAAALARAERGVACGAAGPELGRLRRLQAEAHQWRGEHAAALPRALEAMSLLPRASRPWFQAASEVATAAHRVGDMDRLHALAGLLTEAAAEPGAAGPFVLAASRLMWGLFTRGENAAGRALLEAVGRAEASGEVQEPIEVAAIQLSHATRTMLDGDTAAWLEYEKKTLACYIEAGDLRHAAEEQGYVGYAYVSVGQFELGIAELRKVLAEANRMGLTTVSATAKQNLGIALASIGQLEEAERVERQAIEEFTTLGDKRMLGSSRHYLLQIALRSGDLATAEAQAVLCLEDLREIPPQLAVGNASLALVRLRQQRLTEARAAALKATTILAELGQIEDAEMLIRLADVKTAQASGELAQARTALDAALKRLRDRAARIQDPAVRETFLQRVPEHAELLELERTWRQ
jgi:tetratricopeptide (TPR) repeat protein